MAFFRRSVSKKLPDHLVAISDRVYVFDYCLSTDHVMSDKDYKAYMDSIVKNLHNYHPGASFMVFNFKEGDQRSQLADVLTEHDMTVVDYPLHFAGYALLPVEVIYYFLRSSESWLSLEGQRNVILMHCERGGWPVLGFMLAAFLLYSKKHTEEQQTLQMMYNYKQGYYKQHMSLLYQIGPHPSQIRYLQCISRRNMSSDSFPSDAPLVMDCLVIWNLPLLDGVKACRPIVHIYGQDASSKTDRSPGLLFSSIGREGTTHYYPEAESALVKLDVGCHVQGDVLLECFHLSDDLVSEETLFRAMFHTGFIQSNILPLGVDEIDLSWNAKFKFPTDFKAEVIFSNVNQVPSGEKGHESDNEFFEVEEIFSNLVESPELTEDTCTAQDDLFDDNDRKKDLEEILNTCTSQDECNVDNGAPEQEYDINSSKESAPDIESRDQAPKVEYDVNSSKELVPHSESHEQALKIDFDVESSNEFAPRNLSHDQDSRVELDDNSMMEFAPDNESDEQTLKVESEGNDAFSSLKSRNIVVIDGSHEQHVVVEHGPKPIIEKEKTRPPKLKDVVAKVTMQQRVVSRWVPRNKEATPDATKPKPTVYRWVPKGSASADVKSEVGSS
ncbi:hypothetical protein Ancab_034635 [Ancistrocladus abbreviatus]